MTAKLYPPKPGDPGTNKARRREQFDRRRKYAFVPLAKPDPGPDSQRLKGPARAGRLRCRNVPESMRRESGPLTSCQRGTDCGCGVTVTISATGETRPGQTSPAPEEHRQHDGGVSLPNNRPPLPLNRDAGPRESHTRR